MDVLSPVSDEEREDGEIVDDDLEDISDYSIPSCGKSDYSDGIIRAISLSSISGSEGGRGEREYCERKVLLTALSITGRDASRKRRSRNYLAPGDDARGRSHTGAKKKRLREVAAMARGGGKYQRRRKSFSRSASLSSTSASSDASEHVIDRRTLRQLNKAVRIDTHTSCEPEMQHRSLKDRLKCMIHPDLDVDDFMRAVDGDDDDTTAKINANKILDEAFDKELEELRLQALKSAMLKKHMERKKRKEALKALEANINIKEVTTIPNGLEEDEKETRTIEKLNGDDDVPSIGVEDDLDIMRAMLLASMSKKITSEQPSLNPIQNKTTALTLSTSSSPIPPEFHEKNKMKHTRSTSNFPLPPVKPLIIRVNHDSESDTSLDSDSEHPSNRTPLKIESSIDAFLRSQRQKFEAKLAQNDNNASESALDKSFLKLLPKSQQQEYKLLKQKLLQAKKATNGVARKDGGRISKENQPVRRDKRSQPKGKYRELAPLVQQIRAELAAQRRQEEHEKQLMVELKAARAQIDVHKRRHAGLVGQFRKARGIIDLRWQTLATAKAQPQKKPAIGASATSVQVAQLQTKSIETSLSSAVTESTIKQVQLPTSAIVDDAMTIPPPTIQSEKEVKNVEVIPDCVCHDEHIEQDAEQPTADLSEPLTYVSPLDKRETNVSSNPLQMLCPYELFGVCKDASCTYNHCP